VPEAWAQGIADLLSMSPHPDWPDTAWKILQQDAKDFLRGWAAQAHQLCWTAQDLFSVHADAPYARLDGMGLVPLLRGMPVVALTDTSASIKASRGTLTHRKRQSWPPECCLVWELDASS